MKIKAFTLAILVAGCGSPAKENGPIDEALVGQLREEIERVEPQLKFGCGLPTESNQACSGDATSMAGRYLLDGGHDATVWQAVKDSIDKDGRPWRNPLRPEFSGNSFSRDQLLGLVEATLASKDREPLARVQAYFRASRLCPGDDRCDVTPSVALIVKEALGGRANEFERVQDEATLRVEASTAPASYRGYLVARKLLIHAHLGHATPGYRAAARTLKERFPKHIFARYVDWRLSGGDANSFSRDLLVCLQRWQKPGKQWWGDAFDGCAPDSQGHELVALAKALSID